MSKPTVPKKVTLGEYLGEQSAGEEPTEALKATHAYVPRSVQSGFGAPLNEPPNDQGESPTDLSDMRALHEYGKATTKQNPYNPSVSNEPSPPANTTAQLSQHPTEGATYQNEFPERALKGRTADGDFIGGLSPNLGDYFVKNSREADQNQATGHDLLANVTDFESPGDYARPGADASRTYLEPGGPGQEIGKAVYDLLLSKNMYHPSNQSPYLDYSDKGEGAFSKGLYSIQRTLGTFDSQAETVSIEELRKVGYELMMKAQSMSPGTAEDLAESYRKGKFNILYDGMILWPHATQIGGGTVGTDELKARITKGTAVLGDASTFRGAQDDFLVVQSFDTILGLGREEPNDDRGTLNFARSAESFGTMNSPVEPFSGAFAMGMAFPVIFTIGLTVFVGNLLLSTVSDGFKADTTPGIRIPEEPWNLPLGRSHPQSSDFLMQLLYLYGFDPADSGSDFYAPMMAGIMTTYGFPNALTPLPMGPDILESVVNLIYAPGFYLVITKGILRGLSKIMQAIASITEINSITSALGYVFELLETVFGSYLFKWMAVMAKVGRIVLKSLEPGQAAHGSDYLSVAKGSNHYILNASSRISNTRIFRGAPGAGAESTLSLNRHHAIFLPGVAEAGLKGIKQGLQSLGDHILPHAVVPDEEFSTLGRIDPDTVQGIEEVIDLEYCPFSIHDLRTNEVISLPAFIDQINDDFATEYNSTHGFGRTDPVYTYSKTTRTINLVFNLVAMNETDHDYMYYLLNKLVTMCYPQRDMGVLRKQGAGKESQYFIQPFSQTPTGAPVVRIRLGDLIGSNKSTHAMMNIFGGANILGLHGDIKNEDILQKRIESSEARKAQLMKISQDQEAMQDLFAGASTNIPKDVELVIEEGAVVAIEHQGKYITFQARYPFVAKTVKPISVAGKQGAPVLGKPAEDGPKATIYEIKPEDNTLLGSVKDAYAVGGITAAGLVKRITDDAGLISFNPFADNVPEAKMYVSPSQADRVTILPNDADVMAAVELAGVGKNLQAGWTFLSPESNPVVHSFENSKGRGLAGVITQMGLNYDQAKWGSNRTKGLRAPMNIKISLSFAPIHDMPLGLTSEGKMFAPSHPTGPYMPKRLDEYTAVYSGGTNESIKARLQEVALKAKAGTRLPFAESQLLDPSKPTLPF